MFKNEGTFQSIKIIKRIINNVPSRVLLASDNYTKNTVFELLITEEDLLNIFLEVRMVEEYNF